jgi:hypothetical protein
LQRAEMLINRQQVYKPEVPAGIYDSVRLAIELSRRGRRGSHLRWRHLRQNRRLGVCRRRARSRSRLCHVLRGCCSSP